MGRGRTRNLAEPREPCEQNLAEPGGTLRNPVEPLSKPRDVMPQGARTLPAEYYVDPAYFRREMEALFGRMWVCAGRTEQVDRPGRFFVRELARRKHHHRRARVPDASTRSTTSAVIAARSSAPRPRGRSPAASSVPITRGRTTSRDASWARRTWTRSRTSGRRTTRCIASTATCGTGTSSSTCRTRPQPLRRPARGSPRQVPALAHGGSAARPPDRLRRAGELEAADSELQRVPPLPEPSPGAQQALALSERRKRAAARDLYGWTDGSAARRGDAVDGRDLPARVPAGAGAGGYAARVLLRDLSEHAPQPAPRLHARAHAMADRAGAHDQHLRMALPSRGARAARGSTRRMRSSSGT